MADAPMKKSFRGLVVSDKMDKTRVVLVYRTTRHPLYDKVKRSKKKYHVHDPKNESRTGDTVKFIETRPLSKTKRWRLGTILTRAQTQ